MTEQVIVASSTISSGGSIPPVPLSLVDLGKRLLDASKRGDTYEIRTLMSSGAPFTTDWLGTSPLHFASMHGHTDTVSILLRAGISRDARTKVDRTPLHVAAQAGHFEIVQLLLKNNAIVDACDMLKMTPLHWAVENGHTNVVNLLLKNSAATHVVDKFDRTPMDIALGNMQMDIVQLLQGASSQQTQSFTSQEAVVEEEEVLTTESGAAIEQVVSSANQSLSAAVDDTKDNIGQTHEITTEDHIALASTDPDSVDGSGEGNTSVLAALAALAEATASNTASSADTASWLSSRGLSLANNNSGTPFTLTEAGKLALTNFMKDQGLSGDSNTVMTLVDEDGNQVLLVQQPQDGEVGEGQTEVMSTDVQSQDTTDLHIDTSQVTQEEMIEEAVE